MGKISGGYADKVEEVEYQSQQRAIIDQIADILEPDGSLFYNHKIRWRDGVLLHPVMWLAGVKLMLREEIIWSRNGSVTLNARMFAPIDEQTVRAMLPGIDGTPGDARPLTLKGFRDRDEEDWNS